MNKTLRSILALFAVCMLLTGCAPAKPVEEFKIASAYLNLTKDINMMWRTKVPSGYENPYMVFTLNGVSYTATSYTLDEQGRLCFMFPGVMPHQLGDNIRATLYATVDGELVSVVKDNYSIKDYAAYILANYPAGSETATLMSDIMVYGEKLQLYRGYKTDALVTEGLTLSPSEFKTLDDTKNKLSLVGTADDYAKWKGAGLYLENAMSVRFSFTATDIEGLTVEITINGRKTVYNASELTKESDGQYKIYFSQVEGDMADALEITIRDESGRQGFAAVRYLQEEYIQPDATATPAPERPTADDDQPAWMRSLKRVDTDVTFCNRKAQAATDSSGRAAFSFASQTGSREASLPPRTGSMTQTGIFRSARRLYLPLPSCNVQSR